MSGRREAWAWVTVVADGLELPICASVDMEGLGPVYMALIHLDRAIVEGPLGEAARKHAAVTGQPIRLIHLVEDAPDRWEAPYGDPQ